MLYSKHLNIFVNVQFHLNTVGLIVYMDTIPTDKVKKNIVTVQCLDLRYFNFFQLKNHFMKCTGFGNTFPMEVLNTVSV